MTAQSSCVRGKLHVSRARAARAATQLLKAPERASVAEKACADRTLSNVCMTHTHTHTHTHTCTPGTHCLAAMLAPGMQRRVCAAAPPCLPCSRRPARRQHAQRPSGACKTRAASKPWRRRNQPQARRSLNQPRARAFGRDLAQSQRTTWLSTWQSTWERPNPA